MPAAAGSWVATWATAPAGPEPGTTHGYPGMSIRNVVHTSIGGTAARVQLSNLFGALPLTLTSVTLGVAAGPGEADAAPGELAPLAFGGHRQVTIAPGHDALSDPVRLRVPAAADLLITTYTPYAAGQVTYHPHARQISYVARGDHTADTAGTAFTGQTPYWRYVTGVDVWTDQAKGCVVAIGDSITDGVTSTVGADHRWPDMLAQRLRGSPGRPAARRGRRGHQRQPAADRRRPRGPLGRPEHAVPAVPGRAQPGRGQDAVRRHRHQRHPVPAVPDGRRRHHRTACAG